MSVWEICWQQWEGWIQVGQEHAYSKIPHEKLGWINLKHDNAERKTLFAGDRMRGISWKQFSNNAYKISLL